MSTSPAEIIARATLDALEQFGDTEWLALQAGRIEFAGSFPQDAFASAILAALEAEGFVVVPKAREVMTYEALEEWLHRHHGEVGVTPALRKAYGDYLAATKAPK